MKVYVEFEVYYKDPVSTAVSPDDYWLISGWTDDYKEWVNWNKNSSRRCHDSLYFKIYSSLSIKCECINGYDYYCIICDKGFNNIYHIYNLIDEYVKDSEFQLAIYQDCDDIFVVESDDADVIKGEIDKWLSLFPSETK